MTGESDAFAGFLQGESALGESQGEGSFTLDLIRARQKLSAFAFPEPGLWVVKLVQAAVASEASSISFTFARKRVTVAIEGEYSWCAEGIRDLLLLGTDPVDRAHFHLRAGLMGACSGPEECLSWACGGVHFSLLNDGLTEESVKPHKRLLISVVRSRSQKGVGFLQSPIRHLFQQTAHENRALQEHCSQAPLEVKIDGRPLDRAYLRPIHALITTPSYSRDADQGWGLPLAVKPLTLWPKRLPLIYPLAETSPSEKFTTQHWPGPEQVVTGVLCLYECRYRVSTLNFMLDGARIERRQALEDHLKSSEIVRLKSILQAGSRHYVFEIYLNTSVEALDLTHFAAREPDASTLVLEVVPDLIEAISRLEQQCEMEWDFPSSLHFVDHFRKTRVADASVIDLATSLYLVPFLPHISILSLACWVITPARKSVTRFVQERRGRELKVSLGKVRRELEALWNSYQEKLQTGESRPPRPPGIAKGQD